MIDYTIEVKQGDNLEPISCIIVMQFLGELSEKKCRKNEITMIRFSHNSDLCHKEGKLRSNKMKIMFFTKDKLFLLIYMKNSLPPFYQD